MEKLSIVSNLPLIEKIVSLQSFITSFPRFDRAWKTEPQIVICVDPDDLKSGRDAFRRLRENIDT